MQLYAKGKAQLANEGQLYHLCLLSEIEKQISQIEKLSQSFEEYETRSFQARLQFQKLLKFNNAKNPDSNGQLAIYEETMRNLRLQSDQLSDQYQHLYEHEFEQKIARELYGSQMLAKLTLNQKDDGALGRVEHKGRFNLVSVKGQEMLKNSFPSREVIKWGKFQQENMRDQEVKYEYSKKKHQNYVLAEEIEFLEKQLRALQEHYHQKGQFQEFSSGQDSQSTLIEDQGPTVDEKDLEKLDEQIVIMHTLIKEKKFTVRDLVKKSQQMQGQINSENSRQRMLERQKQYLTLIKERPLNNQLDEILCNFDRKVEFKDANENIHSLHTGSHCVSQKKSAKKVELDKKTSTVPNNQQLRNELNEMAGLINKLLSQIKVKNIQCKIDKALSSKT